MKQDLTKAQRRRIRELAGIAYDRELSRELAVLEGEFAQWRSGSIDAYELNERIHRFHQGPSRQLFNTYTNSPFDLVIAAAIANGIITEAEAGPELMELFRGWIKFASERSKEEDDDAKANSK